jgi:hypothetical protein
MKPFEDLQISNQTTSEASKPNPLVEKRRNWARVKSRSVRRQRRSPAKVAPMLNETKHAKDPTPKPLQIVSTFFPRTNLDYIKRRVVRNTQIGAVLAVIIVILQYEENDIFYSNNNTSTDINHFLRFLIMLVVLAQCFLIYRFYSLQLAIYKAYGEVHLKTRVG